MYCHSTPSMYKDLGGGVKRAVLAHGGNMMVCEVLFEEGAIGTLHQHPHEQSTYILEGEFLFTVGGKEYRCVQGNSLYKEPNIEHGCVCIKKGRLLDVFTPQRDEFLS